MRASKIRIGLDLHNLSTREDATLRTGIQQVVFYLLEAQHWFRSSAASTTVEIVPLPMLPKNTSHTQFANLNPGHVNNSKQVLSEAALELQTPHEQLWDSTPQEQSDLWTEEKFYEVASTLDWIFITGLCEFRHVIERIKRNKPTLRVGVLIYDLIPLQRPELTVSGMPDWFTSSYVASIRHYADLLITISRHTAIDCERYFSYLLGRNVPIISVPLPPEVPSLNSLTPTEQVSWLNKFGLEKAHYFVCLGTIEPRKNLGLAVEGFARFKQIFGESAAKFKLVVVGKKGWSGEDSRLLQTIGANLGQYVFPGYLLREDVEQLIHLSAGQIMPSRYEGYGMPISLARQLNVQTITCVNSSLPEAAQFESSFVQVDCVDEMAVAMGNVAFKPRQLGENSKEFEWQQRKRDVNQQWRLMLCDWVSAIENYRAHETPKALPSHNTASIDLPRVSKKKLKICVEVHNLSIDSNLLQKTGIQEVTFSILEALSQVRQDLGSELEIIAIPFMPDFGFSYQYAPTCMCSPSVLRQVELEIGKQGPELWGFDLAKMNYRIGVSEFYELVADTDWFFVTSQYDISRCFELLKGSSQNCKIAYLIYDIIPTLFPEKVSRGLADWFSFSFLRSVRNHASFAAGISRSATIDFLEHSENESCDFSVWSRLLPINQASHRLNHKLKEQVLAKHLLNKQKYFCLIGSTDPRKNTANSILGFAKFVEMFPKQGNEYKLVIIGPKVWRTEDIQSALASARTKCQIAELGYLSDSELHCVVSQSAGIAMASRYEGFGIPLALARSYGVPTITCNNSSLPEVVDSRAAFVNPGNIDEIALAFSGILRTKNNDGETHLDNWKDYVTELLQALSMERA